VTRCVAHLNANRCRPPSWSSEPCTNLGIRKISSPFAPSSSRSSWPSRGGDTHGYGIIKESEGRTGGSGRLETGTLYRALRRLTSAGLVEPTGKRPTPELDDERRTYYAITPFGRMVAGAEARRLEAQVEAARARALLSGAEAAGGGG
jgi:DNA-binding PadR family transcriptional regulator